MLYRNYVNILSFYTYNWVTCTDCTCLRWRWCQNYNPAQK